MKLAAESHIFLQSFFREHLQHESLRLPPIKLYGNRLTEFITHCLKISAITIGRRVVVTPKLISRDKDGRLTVSGALLAHEALHVIQYEQAGYVRFWMSYLNSYFNNLRELKRYTAAARLTAYLEIEEEQAARKAEHAYGLWRVRAMSSTLRSSAIKQTSKV